MNCQPSIRLIIVKANYKHHQRFTDPADFIFFINIWTTFSVMRVIRNRTLSKHVAIVLFLADAYFPPIGPFLVRLSSRLFPPPFISISFSASSLIKETKNVCFYCLIVVTVATNIVKDLIWNNITPCNNFSIGTTIMGIWRVVLNLGLRNGVETETLHINFNFVQTNIHWKAFNKMFSVYGSLSFSFEREKKNVNRKLI